MPYSCFGCCSIPTGIGYITFINMLWVSIVIMINVMSRLSNYDALRYDFNETAPLSNHNSTTDYQYGSYDEEPTPFMSEMFMDYICIVRTAWYLMEFYLNVILKQSTYTISTHRIYAWLVIYYFNLGAAIIYQCMAFANSPFSMDSSSYLEFFNIILIGVESYIVQSYYNQQKLAAVDNFVALKWKYLPKPKVKFDKSARHTITITSGRCDPTVDDSGYIPIFVKNLKNINS